MDTNGPRQENQLTVDKNAQIQVMLNSSDANANEIDLAQVFHRMKLSRRFYALLLVLCIFLGICASLLMYQFTKPMLTVSSVVTLNYDVPILSETKAAANLGKIEYKPVEDLTAPDGTELNLSMILSSYVLQKALNGLKLSYPITVNLLRANLQIDRVLSEKSRQSQELAAKMTEEKAVDAYSTVENVSMTYDNKFLVSLTNGFGDEEDKIKYELTDSELRLVLNRVLDAYNDYLILTYSDLKLPDDKLSVIDIEDLDMLESLDLMRSVTNELSEYCEDKTEAVRAYRSSKTGHTLNDWIETLETEREVGIDYLYSYIYTNSLVKNQDAMLINYQYQLRNKQTQLDSLSEDIATIGTILKDYKNDEIFISMQDSDSSKSTSTTTDYFNELVLTQVKNYKQLADIEVTVSDLESKIEKLSSDANDSASSLITQEEIMTELRNNLDNTISIYSSIKDHMEEVMESAFYTSFTEHTEAQGWTKGFLSSALPKALIGGAIGAVIVCVIWFISALIPEFSIDKKNGKMSKEVNA